VLLEEHEYRTYRKENTTVILVYVQLVVIKISEVELLRESVADYSKGCSDSSPNLRALLL
jgi:hypothetical protein